jgi:hypothetical protein
MKSPRFIPLPDPISEEQVSLELSLSADARTTRSIERQAKLMDFATANEYLHEMIGATIAGHEEATVITEDGQLVDIGEFSAS